ncbi:hypothetical protein [Cupriavidus sp. L7L]|uniref:hypothetical protein n=1 Tax=Cupriavidus sp. L7L TaxID=2546443 RepID=UPI0010554D30|nr:hypothetical protein [Cupriavidus sp. L7L]TDF67216.1 hypothetical protein E1J61_02635 [Cupriavidus sp. L7L]
MKRNHATGFAVLAAIAALTASPVMAQKNYTDGGDLYGGAHAGSQGKNNAKASSKTAPQRTGKFDPYTDGARAKPQSPDAKKFPDERPQPDDVARSGKFDPYTEGQSK